LLPKARLSSIEMLEILGINIIGVLLNTAFDFAAQLL
jgi:hypothetical protein